MLHEALFLALYLGLMPLVLLSPFSGVLIYHWLDYLPPDQVYQDTLLSSYLSLTIGALTFLVWLIKEKKTMPRPLWIILLMTALLLWMNITSYRALAPEEAGFLWDRTNKVVGFAILTSMMLSTRERLEAFVWTLVLSAAYFAVPSAIKVLVSGGSGGIGEGEVVAAAAGSFFGDRVILSVVLAMVLPFALFLGRHASLLPRAWLPWVKPAMLALAASMLVASIGTFARTAVFASGAALLMLGLRSRRKPLAAFGVLATILLLVAFAPENWFARMDTIANYEHDDSALSRLDAWKWAWHFTLQHPVFGGGFGVFHLDAGSIAGRSGWLEAHNIFFSVMAQHGFVGLALFFFLMAAVYRSCAVVQRRVRNANGARWVADLARATQVALAAYVAGGMFVSIDTTPFLFILGAIGFGVRSAVNRKNLEISSLPRQQLIPRGPRQITARFLRWSPDG